MVAGCRCLDGFAASFAVVRALAAAVIATIAVTGAGTVDAEPRSIHESIGIDTLGSADTQHVEQTHP